MTPIRSISIRCRRSSRARNMSNIWAVRMRSSIVRGKDFAKGEFRFVAQAVSHLVFADPDNQAARAMLADTFEQLGYAAESSTWRNAYLFGAQELRQGMPKVPPRAADAARNAGGAAHRATMGRARRPPQRPQGRGQAHRAELEFYRHRRELRSQSGELRADLCRRRASRRGGRRLHAGARHARRSHRQADDVSRKRSAAARSNSPAIRCGSAN